MFYLTVECLKTVSQTVQWLDSVFTMVKQLESSVYNSSIAGLCIFNCPTIVQCCVKLSNIWTVYVAFYSLYMLLTVQCPMVEQCISDCPMVDPYISIGPKWSKSVFPSVQPLNIDVTVQW